MERFNGPVRIDSMNWNACGEDNPDELNALIEAAVGEHLQDIEWEVIRYKGDYVIISLSADITGGE